MERKQTKILGFNIDLFNFRDAIDYTKYLLDADYSAQIVTINPEMMECATKDEDLTYIINSAELVVPDGMGIKIALGINGYNQQRVPGVDFAKEFLKVCADSGAPVALIGAKKDIIEKAVKNLKNELPNLNIVYVKDGYFQADEEPQIAQDIKNCGAKFICVALGSPKQEFFIDDCRKVVKNAIWIGVGGSFDVWSGVVKRAPKIYRKLGMEWAYRTLSDLSRLKRIFPALPIFVYKVIVEKLSGKKHE